MLPTIYTGLEEQLSGTRRNALSLVSQYDIELIQNVEKHVGRKMEECKDVKEDDVLLS